MRYWKSWIITSFFIISDIALFYGIFYCAFVIRNLFTPLIRYPTPWNIVLPIANLGAILGIGFFFIQGIYPGYGLTAVKELETISKNITIVFFLLASVFFLNKPFQEFSRFILLFSWLLSLLAFPVAHFILRNILSRSPWYGIPVVIYGKSPWAKDVSNSLKQARRIGWRPNELRPINEIEKTYLKSTPTLLAILAPESGESVENASRLLSLHFRKVLLIRKMDNFGSLWVKPRDLEGKLGLEFNYHLLGRRALFAKRLIDILGSLLLLSLLSPLVGFLILLIKLDSPGQVFFRQERVGQNFKKFKVLKFRTMILDAEKKLQELLEESADARVEFEKYHKLEYDPRLTRTGKYLRRLFLDEIPQLWNVLKGEMSLVGPRPVLDYEIEEMGIYAPIILRVKPGMTGWWQVTGLHKIDFQERVKMEEYYISNWSLWMDIYILLKTVWVVLNRSGN